MKPALTRQSVKKEEAHPKIVGSRAKNDDGLRGFASSKNIISQKKADVKLQERYVLKKADGNASHVPASAPSCTGALFILLKKHVVYVLKPDTHAGKMFLFLVQLINDCKIQIGQKSIYIVLHNVFMQLWNKRT
ncbi:MAG: hypothetical protein MR832_04730 [Clostridiales bacterium]|nr:hypothetical protein [Clostridiales bacterium]